MRKYECMLIIASEYTDENREATIKKLTDVIEKNKGVISNIEKMGTKKLAYPMHFKKEGYYVLINFEADGDVIVKAQNLMNITDGIYRCMFIAK